MSADYLWDRSGPPDPEIERLERVLGTLRHRGDFRESRSRRRVWIPVAVAAAVLLVIAGRLVTPRRPSVWMIAGKPLYTGEVVHTTVDVTLHAEDVGRVDVAPGSELRVLESAGARERLSLVRGGIHALIWAPPRRFVVDTPSSRAIDLGCEYRLSIDREGNGLLEVETGWVAFQFDGRESFIPAGAACTTSRRRGPGTPYFLDASEALRQSLAAFDARGDTAALRHVLAQARARDGLTLWHLLARAPTAERAAVFDRFAGLVKLPAEANRAAVLRGDRRALDACWNALNLDNADWFREWEWGKAP